MNKNLSSIHFVMRVYEHWNFHTLLVEGKISTITLKSNLKHPIKLENVTYINFTRLHIKITLMIMWHCS